DLTKKHTHFPPWRAICELLLMLLALGALVWTCRVAYVDYVFHRMAPLTEHNPIALRLAYAERLKQLLKINPSNAEVRDHLANIEAALGNNQEAIEQLEIALRTNRAQNSLFFLAQKYEKLGQ